ncbi:branched-chain amino acid ABC transporter permease [soil metagenome]
MHLLLQQILSGIASGSLFAMLALAIVLIYRSTGVLNLAQGEIAMFTTFITWSLLEAQISFWLAVGLTLVAAAILGGLIEWLVLRRVEHSSRLHQILVTVGLFTLFNGLALWIWGAEPRGFGPFSIFKGDPLCVDTFCISRLDLGTLLTAMLVMTLLFVIFRCTNLGLAMRATAQNRLASLLVGIPVHRMLTTGWALATMVGALAGILAAQSLGLDTNTMSTLVLFAFTSAILGGIENPFGAVLGGLLVGVLKNLAGTYAPGALGNIDLTLAFALIVLMLMVRPAGLLGRRVVGRV